MKQRHQGFWSWLGRNMRRHFLTGIVVIVPLSITILILLWFFNTIDNILQPAIRLTLGRSIPGLGIVATVALIYLAGGIASNVGGKKLIKYGESLLARIPVVRPLYASIKQITLCGCFLVPDRFLSSPTESMRSMAVSVGTGAILTVHSIILRKAARGA